MTPRRAALLAIMLLAGSPAAAADAGREMYRTSLAGRQACAGCHGRDGQGGSEGTVRAPAIGWDVLTREEGYDAARLGRALAEGIAADGRRLIGMPRYALAPEAVAALAGYLARLPQDDAGGIFPDRIVIAAAVRGPDDSWPALLAAAIGRQGQGRPVFGRAVQIVTLAAGTGAIPAGSEVFVAVGLPAAYPSPVSDALAERGIPNMLPRGFLSGNEAPGDALGAFATLSQIVTAAEKRAECGSAPPLIVASEPETALRLNRAMGTLGHGSAACRIALGLRGDNSMPFAALQTGGTTLHFDPATRAPGVGALSAFAEMAAERILTGLGSAGAAPTRTRFLAALGQALRAEEAPPTFR